MLICSIFICCNIESEKVQNLRVGMTKLEVLGLFGEEPWTKRYNSFSEEWYYTYSYNGYKTGLEITFINEKVESFYSY